MKTNLESGITQAAACDTCESVLIATVVIAGIIAAATFYVYFQEKKEKQMFYGSRKGDDFSDWDEFDSWVQ
jgi:hypothetical protein